MTSVSRRLLVAACFFVCLPRVFGQAGLTAQHNRIDAKSDLSVTARLAGHVPRWAAANNDAGAVLAETTVQLTVLLNRSSERQAAFTKLLADQQDPGSPSYHHWLTPEQVGEQYGPAQADVDAVGAWLGSRGLRVTEITPSRVFMHVGGTAGAVAQAFATELRYFNVNGARRYAAVSDPAVPAAFAGVLGSIAGLSEIHLEPMHRMHSMPMAAIKGGGAGEEAGTSARPNYTNSNSGRHFVTPGDFSIIFDVQPSYSAGYTGTGQKVAIIGRSRVEAKDISEFESATGLPVNAPNTIIPTNGVDPGISDDGDQGEATLDVDRVIGTAPGVQADLVVSSSAGGYDGIYVAAQYEVQKLLDPVMNISFGACEVYAGPGSVSLWDTLFAQAASEGISVFVSSADSGAATCDAQFSTPPDYQFRSINYICASSYATCVGATEFADTANPGQYWSATNSANLVSALGYIPEGAWNEPTAVTTSAGRTNYIVASGGGGASIYVPKPAWQTGTGIPADGARDVPDVSFPGAGHDGYFACFAAGGGDCANNRFEYFEGTSAAAPTMAAVTALLNQKNGSSQGNINPLLYRVAAATPGAFHDVTPASSGVAVCSTDYSSMCNNSTPSLYGISGGLAGFGLTTGYDQATGLGSLDVTKFLNAAVAGTTSGTETRLAVTESASMIANTGTAVFTAKLTAASATGTVQFFANSIRLGAPVTLNSGSAVTSALPFAAAGSYLITASYSGDTSFLPSVSPGISFEVTGISSQVSVSPASALIPSGRLTAFTATIAIAPGAATPTGIVRFILRQGTSGEDLGAMPLVNGIATTSVAIRPVGSYAMMAYYLGDTVYSPSNSAATAFSVQKQKTQLLLSTYPTLVGTGGYKDFAVSALVTPTDISVPSPTGMIQMYANGAPLGSPITFADSFYANAAPDELFSTAGTYSVTAVYLGDQYDETSTSDPVMVTVTSTPAAYLLTAGPAAVAADAGMATTVYAMFAATGGFEGTVTPACSIKYNGTSAQGAAPVCSLSPASVNLGSTGGSSTASITISTTARNVQAPLSIQANRNTRSWSPGSLVTLAFIPLLLSCVSRRGRSWRSVLVLSVVAGVLAGCGGASNTNSTPTSPTPTAPVIVGTAAGSYTVTITASTPNASVPVPAPVTIALTVN